MSVHPTAIIDPSAKVDADVSVGPYSIIGADVSIGAGCWIGPHVVINGPTRIGENNRFFQFASIGEIPQDLKFAGEKTRLEIGNGNTFRECMTIHRGTPGGSAVTRVGDSNLFMAYTHVAHDCIVDNHTIFSNCASLAGHVVVQDYAILGGFTTVQQFCIVGAHCFIGMSSAVSRDVAPYTKIAGNPAKAYGINKQGLRRRGFDDACLTALHKTYKALIRYRGSREAVMPEIDPLRERFPEVELLVSFIDTSQRGVVR